MNYTSLKTPGVYVNEISIFPPSIAEVPTAIPAFVGYTESAKAIDGTPLDMKPTKISSLVEYQLYFGSGPSIELTSVELNANNEVIRVDSKQAFYLFDSLRLFFNNGGGECYIISVGKYTDPINKQKLIDGVNAVRDVDEPTLLVVPDAVQLPGVEIYEVQQAMLKQCADLMDRFAILDIPYKNELFADFNNAVTEFRNNIGMGDLKYGAAYGPWLKVSSEVKVSIAELSKAGVLKKGGAATDLKALTASLTAADKQAVDALIDSAVANPADMSKEETLKNSWPLYKSMIEGIRLKTISKLPPSGAMAGIYARVDSERGVWKAPANVSITMVQGVTVNVNDERQKPLNVDVNAGKSINILRVFSGKGTLVWGARTLAGNDNEWRYISVRRFFNMVEESVKKSTAWAVFEPNDANTWLKVKTMIENYLMLLWRQGALAGAKPDEAFRVYVGLNQTMTSVDILEGRMIVRIEMAVVRPAEFIILEFAHKLQTS